MTVTAWPVSSVREPRSEVRTRPVRADPWRPVSSARPSRADQNGASAVRAARDRVLVDADAREEAARHEVVAAVRVLGRRGDDDAAP